MRPVSNLIYNELNNHNHYQGSLTMSERASFRGRGGSRGVGHSGGGDHHGGQSNNNRGGGRGGGGGGGGYRSGGYGGGSQQQAEKPKKENILDLTKYMDKAITVKFTGGREGLHPLHSLFFAVHNKDDLWFTVC